MVPKLWPGRMGTCAAILGEGASEEEDILRNPTLSSFVIAATT